MVFKIRSNQKCREFDIYLDEHRLARHTALMMEFNGRGVASPRGGFSGPAFTEGDRTTYQVVFFLAEEVADEYVERMKRRVTNLEKEMNLNQLRTFLKSASS